MKNNNPFEQQWLEKLKNGLANIGQAVLFNKINTLIQTDDQVEWNRQLMTSLSENLSEAEIQKVMCSCACRKPKDDLKHIRDEYERTHDLEHVHALLQGYFEKFIKSYKNLNDDQMNFLRESGWGLAGKLENNVIRSIKIPKEFHNYFNEKDEKKKRYYYCHCPRIRESIFEDKPIDGNYCYCGAGFYKDIWEYITQRDVKVRILESILKGDKYCKIAIYL